MAVGGCLAQWDKRHHTTPKSRVRAPVSSLGPLLTIYHRQGRRRGGHRMPDHHQPGDFLHGFADEATKSHSVAYSRPTACPPSVPCVPNLARPLRLFRARPLHYLLYPLPVARTLRPIRTIDCALCSRHNLPPLCFSTTRWFTSNPSLPPCAF